MTQVLVATPVLNRPGRVQPLLDSLARTRADPDTSVLVLFLVTYGDREEIDAITAAVSDWPDTANYGLSLEGMDFPHGPGDYARKINWAASNGHYDWFFQGADDLRFHPDWLLEALAVADRTGKAVIGTNDLGNPLVRAGRHAVHCLVRADYIREQGTWDEPGKLLHEGYGHNWVDNELIGTAIARHQFFPAKKSIVEHLHPVWRDRQGRPKAETDSTYQLGQRSYRQDQDLYQQRRRLWQPELPAYRRRYAP